MIYGFINKFVSLAMPFVVRSVMIYKLGMEYLGLNELFSSILNVLNVAELGFGNAMVYNMYKPIAEGDERQIFALLNLYKKIYRYIGGIILAGGLSVLPFLPKFIKGGYPKGIDIYILFLIYLFDTIISYWMFAYKTSLLNAFQRVDVISNINTIMKLLLNVSQIIILCVFRNYYLCIMMMPVCTIMNNLMNVYMVNKMFPEYKCEGILDSRTIQDIKQNIMGLAVYKICGISRNSFDSIFISAFLGLATSAIYSNYFYIIAAVTSVLSIILNSMLAGVGSNIVNYDASKNYMDMKKFDFLYMWVGGWCTICLACLIQPFMRIWVGKNRMFDYSVVLLLCIYFYVHKMGDIRGLYADAAGLWWQNRYRTLIEAVTNIILNYLLVQFLGVQGVILATLFSLLIAGFMFGAKILFRNYFKNEKLLEYFKLHAIYFFVTLIIGTITYLICFAIKMNGIIGFMIKFFICISIPNILYVIAYYRTKIYATAVPWILNVMHMDKKLSIFIPKLVK